jgi:hypothetical protein
LVSKTERGTTSDQDEKGKTEWGEIGRGIISEQDEKGNIR